MSKRLIIIGGAMGVGKTAASRELQKLLPRNVFLDGDWCWAARPFAVNDETKAMVMGNIAYLLNAFLTCSAYDNIIFCWVLHEQSIIDELLARLRLEGVETRLFSLVCSPETLRARLERDVAARLRERDVIARALGYGPLYAELKTEKIYTDNKTPAQTAAEIIERLN